MKKYEKPCLTAISLSGNNQLCGSCTAKGGIPLEQDTALADFLLRFWGLGDGDGVAERSDFENVFGESEKGCADVVSGYCKFTSTSGDSLVAWS